MTVQAEKPVLPHHLTAVVELLHADVVEVVGPVHGRTRVGLGHHEQPLFPRLRPRLGGQQRERVRPLLVMAQNAEAGARDRAQGVPIRPFHEVVLAAAEEREVTMGEPSEQLVALGEFRGGSVARPGAGGSLASMSASWTASDAMRGPSSATIATSPSTRRRCSSSPAGGVADRPTSRWIHASHCSSGCARMPVDLAAYLAQRTRDIAPHPQLRVDHQVDTKIVTAEFHRHRVDEEGHVVRDDVDQRPAGLQAPARPPRLARPARGQVPGPAACARRAWHAPRPPMPPAPDPARPGPRARHGGSTGGRTRRDLPAAGWQRPRDPPGPPRWRLPPARHGALLPAARRPSPGRDLPPSSHSFVPARRGARTDPAVQIHTGSSYNGGK